LITRRRFLTASAGCAIPGLDLAQIRGATYDILIRNGEVHDPSRGFHARADLAILDGKIAAIGNSLAGAARDTIDAKGLYVAPGLVDLHTHIFWGGGNVPSVEPDPIAARSGVTTWVDAGS
jgi:dihydroorotase